MFGNLKLSRDKLKTINKLNIIHNNNNIILNIVNIKNYKQDIKLSLIVI